MFAETIKRLQETRGKAWDEAKALNDSVEEAKRDFSAEEQATWDRLNGEIEAADKRIKELVDAEEREADADKMRERVDQIARTDQPATEPTDEEERIRSFIAGETRSVEFKWTREELRARYQKRDLTEGSATAGGNTVPVSFISQLYQHLIEHTAIRQTNATVLTTDSGEELRVPKTTAHGAAALVAEAAVIPESDPTFGQVVFGAFKYGQLLQASSELIEDTAVDLLGYLAQQAGRNLGDASGAHFITGDGVGKPNGVVTASTLGKTFAGAAVITADELIDLYFSVIAPYRTNATWMFKDSTMALVRKLKDTTNQYLWQPGLVSGTPDQILGRPVLTDPNMPAATTGNKSVLFGDFSTYYIRDVNGVRFERSDDFAFNADLVTFRALLRTDGDLVDTTGAVKHGIQA